ARNVPVEVRGADIVVAASRAVALQVPALKPIVIYAGVESPEQILPGKTVGKPAIVVGAACRLVPPKGLLDLIRAVALLHLQFPNLQLEIAGTGPQRDDLELEVSCLGLRDKVRFLGWQRDLRSTLRDWDIFVLPSLDEGFGIAALEAMMEGLPV